MPIFTIYTKDTYFFLVFGTVTVVLYVGIWGLMAYSTSVQITWRNLVGWGQSRQAAEALRYLGLQTYSWQEGIAL